MLAALGDGAWVSHEAAAAIHTFDRTKSGEVELCVVRSKCWKTFRCGTVHTTYVKGLVDVITVDGFPCASATRAILDLVAVRAPEARLAAAIVIEVSDRLDGAGHFAHKTDPTMVATIIEEFIAP